MVAATAEYQRNNGMKFGDVGYTWHTDLGYKSLPDTPIHMIERGCNSRGAHIDIRGRGIGLQGGIDQKLAAVCDKLGAKMVVMKVADSAHGSDNYDKGLARITTTDMAGLAAELAEQKLIGPEMAEFIAAQESVTSLEAQKMADAGKLLPRYASARPREDKTAYVINEGTRMPDAFDVAIGDYIREHPADVASALAGESAPPDAKLAAEALSITRRREEDAKGPRHTIQIIMDEPGEAEQRALQKRHDAERLLACADSLCPTLQKEYWPDLSRQEVIRKLAGAPDIAKQGTVATATLNMQIEQTTGQAPATGGRTN